MKKKYGMFQRYLSPLEKTSQIAERARVASKSCKMADEPYLCLYEAKHSSTKTFSDKYNEDDNGSDDEQDKKDKKDKKK